MRFVGINKLGKTKNRIQRRTQLVAHVGKKFRLGKIGLFSRRLCRLEGNMRLLQRRIQELAFCNIASGSEYALQGPVTIVIGGRVKRHYGFLAIPGAGS